MKTTIAAVLTAILLSGCMGQQKYPMEQIEPENVTNVERQMVRDCQNRLTEQWPVGEPIVLTTIVRDSVANHIVGINFAFTMDQAAVDKVLAKGVKNQGWCQYENNKLTLRNWLKDVNNLSKMTVLTAGYDGDFK